MMKVFLGADHAGYQVKEEIKKLLTRKGITWEDMGGDGRDVHDDYPDYALAVARAVAKKPSHRGIVICGTGTGMVMAANRIKGARAAVAYDTYSAKMSREDNNANILALRARHFPIERIKRIVSIWLSTPFSGKPRHRARLKKFDTKGDR